MIERAAGWLEYAGIKIPRKPNGSPDCTIEISPAFALDKTDLIEKTSLVPKINPKDQIYLG